ncbi:MAG: XdhC family protein [Hyphomicrobiales bacterium]|nr:XdhC family protein [Hyphomicrobiales bacterium]
MDLQNLRALNAERQARRAALVMTDTASGAQQLVKAADVALHPQAEALEAFFRSGKSGPLEVDGQMRFVTVHNPPVRLVLIGAVHISQALAPMAAIAGLDVTVIDPRTAFASPERFPHVQVLAEWPDEALARQKLDAHTGVALLTHDPKIDDPALIAALRADCFYIGALGSRKTHAARRARMTAQGFDEAALARIHAPIGLDIGAVSPPEIAAAILGEIILALRKKPLRAEAAS